MDAWREGNNHVEYRVYADVLHYGRSAAARHHAGRYSRARMPAGWEGCTSTRLLDPPTGQGHLTTDI